MRDHRRKDAHHQQAAGAHEQAGTNEERIREQFAVRSWTMLAKVPSLPTGREAYQVGTISRKSGRPVARTLSAPASPLRLEMLMRAVRTAG